jgi:hypothetical protein
MRRLPNADRAIVPERKIMDYLLSTDHAKGAAKAGFFLRFGYSREDWRSLAETMRQHARLQPVVRLRRNDHGEIYEVRGPVSTLDGRNPKITTVWMILDGEIDPRFVTAVPA